jgi:hypothetical protein
LLTLYDRAVKRRGTLVVAAMCLAASVVGWHVIGDRLIASLQVEYPGTYNYEEYTFMRDASPWAGAAIGLVICGSAICVAVALRSTRAREPRDDGP